MVNWFLSPSSKERDWNHPLFRIDHFELIKRILFYLKSVLMEVIVRENFICVKNGMLGKQLATNEIQREMNSAEYCNQHLSLGHLKFMFFSQISHLKAWIK